MYGPRLFIAMGAIAAALAAILCIVKLMPRTNTAAAAVTIRGEAPGDIRLLRIANAHGEFEIRHTGEGYEVHDIPAPLVDYERFMRLMEGCARLQAKRIAAERPDGAAPFGLADPVAEVSVNFASGPDLTFYIGAAEPIGKDVYFSVRGRPAVYLMGADEAGMFTLRPKDFINTEVTEKPSLASPLSAIVNASFAGGGLAGPVTVESVTYGGPEIKRKALSHGAVTHLVSEGGESYELDQTYGVRVLGSLLNITADGVEAYNCTDAELAAMGFDSPWLAVEFEYVNGIDENIYRLKLSVVPAGGGREDANAGGVNGNIGVNNDSGRYLIRRGNEDVVFNTGILPFMEIDASRLMTRWYLSPMIMDLKALKVAAGETMLEFAINNERSPLEVSLNGAPCDAALFRKFFRLLTSAAHDGETLIGVDGDPSIAADPLITIEYIYLDAEKPPDAIAFYRWPPRKLAVAVNGKAAKYGMRAAFAERAAIACEAIAAGKDFDENW